MTQLCEIEAEQAKWNKILASEGLSVWEGTDHHLVYMEHLSVNRSPHPRSFVNPDKSAGDSDARLYEQLAVSDLSDRDRKFLEAYQTRTVPEVAAEYEISIHAVYCRVSSIRRKINVTAKTLKERQ